MVGQEKQAGTDGILRDGKNDWVGHKEEALKVAEAYAEVDPVKAARISVCGDFLGFRKEAGGGKKLVKANFCKIRLCPMCQWRRSKKVFAQMSQIMDYIAEHERCRYLFVTLTVRNCEGDKLRATLDRLSEAWHRLQRFPEFSVSRKGSLVQGWYRAVEVTHNISHDTYHPHIHAIFAVAPSYFRKTNEYYCTFERLQEIWSQAARLDYDPDVSINAIQERDPEAVTKAIAEICKYSVKSKDYIIPGDWEFSVETIRTLDRELHNRRFLSFGGIFRRVHKLLHLDDMETGDLVELAGEDTACADDSIVWYVWRSGYRQYVRD